MKTFAFIIQDYWVHICDHGKYFEAEYMKRQSQINAGQETVIHVGGVSDRRERGMSTHCRQLEERVSAVGATNGIAD
jgi:hypothetical protein